MCTTEVTEHFTTEVTVHVYYWGYCTRVLLVLLYTCTTGVTEHFTTEVTVQL